MIEHLERHYDKDLTIADMVVSHADNDHAKGLIPVFKHFKVANLWMNRPWLYAQEVLDQFHGNWSLDGWIKEVRSKRAFYASKINQPIPTEAAEQANVKAGDAFYDRGGAWLRENTRGKKFSVLLGENITYGYRRNLLGLKWPALLANLCADPIVRVSAV